MKNKKGFTLIELIVSVTIIALLTVVAMVSYTGTNKKARDSRRMADMEKIRMAVELYRQGTGSTYPLTLNLLMIGTGTSYIQSIPAGPKGETYIYSQTSGSNGYAYTIGTSLEDLGSTNTNSYSGCSGCNYKVTNP